MSAIIKSLSYRVFISKYAVGASADWDWEDVRIDSDGAGEVGGDAGRDVFVEGRLLELCQTSEMEEHDEEVKDRRRTPANAFVQPATLLNVPRRVYCTACKQTKSNIVSLRTDAMQQRREGD